MASEKVFSGLRRNNSELKRAHSIKLKGKIFEHENEYRRRFSTFVDTFKDAANQSQCLTHTRIKTILKVMHEVLRGSDELLMGFDRRRSYQPVDAAVYEQIIAHRRRWADGLYTYCAQLQDIGSLLHESCAPRKDKTYDSLLPIHHVQELRDIFQEVKKELVENRRLVEVFSCNTLIEQLNEELERMRKVMTSIGAESLLLELHEMAANYNRQANIVKAALTTTCMETKPNLLELPAGPQEHKEKDHVVESLSVKEIDQVDRGTDVQSETSTTESYQEEGNNAIKVKITRSSNIPLSRRDSKKRMRYQVQSFASKLSEMKDDLFLLEKKLEELKMLGIDSSSEDESESMTEDCEAKDPTSYDDTVQGEEIKQTPFSRIKDSQTKALLRSSMRRAPLYQNYQQLPSRTSESSPTTPTSADDDTSATIKDEINATRPESGIVMEEGLYNDSDENIFSDGSELNENTGDSSHYVQMNGVNFRRKTQNLRKVNNSNDPARFRTYSLQFSNSDNESIIYPNYTNMRKSPIIRKNTESYLLAVQSDNSAVQNRKMPANAELLRALPTIMTPKCTRQRVGWCHIPLVKESGVLERMTSKQRTLQEAKYEMISSKVSYLKSLSIVQSVFIANEELRKLITPTEWNNLFQLIGPIKNCSEHFLSDLLSGWPQDIFLTNQLSVIRQYAESGLEVYVDFCSHKITMDDTLKDIRANNPRANKVLTELEHEEICDGHDLESFLVLPIQRITRFPLLVEAILWRMDSNNDKDFCDWAKTYDKLRMVAKRCNDAVKDAETRKLSLGGLRSPSNTLPTKRNKMSSMWNDQD